VIDYVCPKKLKSWALQHYSENKFVQSWALQVSRKAKCNGMEVDALLDQFLVGDLTQTQVYAEIKSKHEQSIEQYGGIKMQVNDMMSKVVDYDLQKIVDAMSEEVTYQYLDKELKILSGILIKIYTRIKSGL
jgi:hypothetical protein